MIELSVMEICHECEKFDPIALKNDLCSNDKKYAYQTVVTCEHNIECRNMLTYLKKLSMMESTENKGD